MAEGFALGRLVGTEESASGGFGGVKLGEAFLDGPLESQLRVNCSAGVGGVAGSGLGGWASGSVGS